MLKEHMRVHDNIREYLCAECGKGEGRWGPDRHPEGAAGRVAGWGVSPRPESSIRKEDPEYLTSGQKEQSVKGGG